MNSSEQPSSKFKVINISYSKFYFEREENLPKHFNLSTNVEISLKQHSEDKRKYLLQYRLNNIELPDNPIKIDVIARLFFDYLGQKEDEISKEVASFVKCSAIYQISSSCNQMVSILASQVGIKDIALPQPDGSMFEEKKK
jgi:hypothetical protein